MSQSGENVINNCFSNALITYVICQARLSNIWRKQIFFLTDGRTKKDIERFRLGVWEIVMMPFLYFPNFLKLND